MIEAGNFFMDVLSCIPPMIAYLNVKIGESMFHVSCCFSLFFNEKSGLIFSDDLLRTVAYRK